MLNCANRRINAINPAALIFMYLSLCLSVCLYVCLSNLTIYLSMYVCLRIFATANGCSSWTTGAIWRNISTNSL